jgi:hypothetical protein
MAAYHKSWDVDVQYEPSAEGPTPVAPREKRSNAYIELLSPPSVSQVDNTISLARLSFKHGQVLYDTEGI